MAEQGGNQGRRLGERTEVHRAAIVIEHRKRFGRVKEELVTAEIRDLSVTGALLALPSATPLVVGQVCGLEISRERGRMQVRRIESDETELLCGIEFIDARPAFLPTIYQWLDRDDLVPEQERR